MAKHKKIKANEPVSEIKTGHHTAKKENTLFGFNRNLVLIAIIVIVICVAGIVISLNLKSSDGKAVNIFGFLGGNNTNIDNTVYNPSLLKNESTAKAKLELFVMSQCPYGVQAEDMVIPLLEKLGTAIDFRLNFIADYDENSNVFNSLHGQIEVNEDLRQMCIMQLQPDAFLNYLKCLNPGFESIMSGQQRMPTEEETVAKSNECMTAAKINSALINSCFSGEQGKNYLKENIKRAQGLNVGSSPTIYLDDVPYESVRTADGILRKMCESDLKGNAECANLPPETKVNLIVVNDATCIACDTAGLESQLKSIFPLLEVKQVDFASEEGKKLIADFNASGLPIILFDETVKSHYNYEMIANYLNENGSNAMLRIPTAKLINRELKEKNFDLFVMSQCPYGVMAENAFLEVAKALPELNWQIHFIASETNEVIDSLHGEVEANEDLRQIAIQSLDKQKYLSYLACINPSYQSISKETSEVCMTTAGIDSAKVQEIIDSKKALELLREDIKINEELQVSSSPTMLSNNQAFINYDGTAEGMKQEICSANQGMQGCEKTLSGTNSTADVPAGSCS